MILSKKTGGTDVMIEGLNTFTSYYVKVAAFTKEGNGVKSDKIICTTAQDGESFICVTLAIYKLINKTFCRKVV